MDIIEGGRFSGPVSASHGGVVAGRDAHVTYQSDQAHEIINYRKSYIGDLFENLTASFVGRKDALDHIFLFAQAEQAGYLLVQSPAGFGKSALMTQVIKWVEKDPDYQQINILYFFIRQINAQHTAQKFYQAVNSQLIQLLSVAGGLPNGLAALESQFQRLWEAALARASAQNPLLLIVDGLDEMAPETPNLAQLLPKQLAAYAHVLVSSRPHPDPKQLVSQQFHPLAQAEVLRLDRFGKIEIQEMLAGSGYEEQGEVIEQILVKTQGEPLFARFVCEDVMQKGAKILSGLSQEISQAGIVAYFKDQLSQLRKSIKGGEISQQILGFLLCVNGGISAKELADLLTRPLLMVEEALAPIKRYLIGREQLEFMHLEFERAVREWVSDAEHHAYHEQILRWCQRYQAELWPANTPAYILHHYDWHLEHVGEIEALFDLLDRRWMEAKYARFASHKSLLDDVERAIRLADERDLWLPLIRNCFLYAALNERGQAATPKMIGKLAEMGEIERAKDMAELLQKPADKWAAWMGIAKVLQEKGKDQEVPEILNRVGDFLEVSLEQPEDELYFLMEMMKNWCSMLIQTGQITRVVAFLRKVRRDYTRQELEQLLEKKLYEQERWDDLLGLYLDEKLIFSHTNTAFITELGKKCIDSSRYEEAIALYQKMNFSYAVSQEVDFLLEKGRIEQLVALLAHFPETSEWDQLKKRSLTYLFEYYIEQGQITRANQLLELPTFKDSLPNVLLLMGTALLVRDKVSELQELINAHTQKRNIPFLIQKIGNALIQRGLYDKVHDIPKHFNLEVDDVEQLLAWWHESQILYLFEQKQEEQAQVLFDRLEPPRQVELLGRRITKLSQDQEVEEAIKLLSALSPHEAWINEHNLRSVFQSLIDQGQLADLQIFIENMQQVDKQDVAWQQLSICLVRARYPHQEPATFIQKIQNPEVQADTWISLAHATIKSSQALLSVPQIKHYLNQATEILRRSDQEKSFDSRLKLANILAEIGDKASAAHIIIEVYQLLQELERQGVFPDGIYQAKRKSIDLIFVCADQKEIQSLELDLGDLTGQHQVCLYHIVYGEFEQAREILEGLTDFYSIQQLSSKMIVCLAHFGYFEEAFEMIENQKLDSFRQGELITEVALAYLKTHELAHAHKQVLSWIDLYSLDSSFYTYITEKKLLHAGIVDAYQDGVTFFYPIRIGLA